jgi:A/G-specific adenine glycosylase
LNQGAPPHDTAADAASIRGFQRQLLQWYDDHGRDLPWRRTRDPYRILVSEFMLHQTQVERVIPKYHEWLQQYPTFEALAAAPVDDVKALWRPLGYYFRAERLHQIAHVVTQTCRGRLPDTVDELIVLPGVGRYTAGAILSFAFHKDAPIVDTNVRRVLRRLFGVPGNPLRAAANKRIWQLAEAILPPGKAYVFNQALLDFGALLCLARTPRCSVCFIAKRCQWNMKRT